MSTGSTYQPDIESRNQLIDVLYGPWYAALTHTIAKLDIAELMAHTPQSVETLARASQAHPRSLYRVLRACASIGLLEEDEGARFKLTRMGHFLRRDIDGTLYWIALTCGHEIMWKLYASLMHTVKTGQSGFDHLYGMHFFDYLAKNTEDARLFGACMESNLKMDLPGVVFSLVSRYDFSEIQRVVDVGGGSGQLIGGLLSVVPELKGILLDMAPILPVTAQRLNDMGVGDRCELRAGSFFESVPPGGDLYLIRRALCDWDDARALKILENCHKAMVADAETGDSRVRRLVLIEDFIRPMEKSYATLTDIQIMMGGGRERTEDDWKALLQAARFELVGIFPTLSQLCLIEGVPLP